MKHIVVGGDGFVGRHLAADLRAMGEQVVVADVDRSDLDIYRSVPFIEMDIVDRRALDRLPLEPEDVVYNMSAKMLSPIMPKAKRHDFFFPVNTDGVRNLLEFMSTRGANSSRAVLDRHDLRSHQGAAGQRRSSGRAARRIWAEQARSASECAKHGAAGACASRSSGRASSLARAGSAFCPSSSVWWMPVPPFR